MLSVVIPLYNEEMNIKHIHEEIDCLMNRECIDYEIIFVNDGSKDNSWKVIRGMIDSGQAVNVVGVCFTRNFGKEAAIFSGLQYAKGDVCAVMDCDLQHPPEILIEMYRLWKDGYEIIEGVKHFRGKENIFYRGFAKLFYKLISKTSGIEMYSSSDFKMLDRKVVDAYIDLKERNVFFRALSSWLGFKSISVPFDVMERKNGVTKWSLKTLVRYAFGSITSFTTAPMQLITMSGVLFFIFAVVLAVQSLIKWGLGHAVEGFTTVILLLLIIGSLIMISLGIIGYYLSKIYEEIKGRPRSIVAEIIGRKV